jgi:hypothetical protein
VFLVHGTHDDPSHFDVDDLLAFAASCENAQGEAVPGGGIANAAANR